MAAKMVQDLLVTLLNLFPSSDVCMNPSIQYVPQCQQAKSLLLDANGFLIDPDSWSREIAKQLAHIESISELTDNHWRVIEFVRNHYLRLGAPPLKRRVCRQLELSPYQAHQLFNSCLQLWRIAGLPDPGDEARAHSF